MQCIIYKIYFLKVFHMYYNLICIFLGTPICTKKNYCKKVGVTYLLPAVDRIMKHGVEAANRIMKHGMENKLLKIFEAFRLSWVQKLVTMSYNRRGGTCLFGEHLAFRSMRDALLPMHLPFEENVRRALSTRASPILGKERHMY
jgi:hypothetical protein